MRRRDVLAADRLEVEDVDRLLGRLDELVRAHRRPHQWIGELAPRRQAFAGKGFEPASGEQRTSGEELQELAPAGGAVGKRRHGEPSLKSDKRQAGAPALSAGMRAALGPSYTADASKQSGRGLSVRGTRKEAVLMP